METWLIVIAFWLLFAGVFGLSPVFRNRGRLRLAVPRRAPPPPPEVLPTAENPFSASLALRPSQTTPHQPGLSGLFSEIDLLRTQVEDLRSEVVALTNAMPGRPEHTRRKRHGTGLYSELPRLLRQHVREVRSERRPLRA